MPEALIQYSILAAGLAASLILFFACHREIDLAARRQRRKIEELETRFQWLETRQEDVRQEDVRQDGARREAMPAFPPRAAFNFHQRTQALRLLRRGEDVAHVAAALGVPRAEIELLVRIQQLVHTA